MNKDQPENQGGDYLLSSSKSDNTPSTKEDFSKQDQETIETIETIETNKVQIKNISKAKPREEETSTQVLFADEPSLVSALEAIVFASPHPIKAKQILEILQDQSLTAHKVITILNDLEKYYREKAGGFLLINQPGQGYQFQTTQQVSHLMERMFAQKARPLSRAAQETLSIIAYRQPVTRADIEYIRGVDAGSIIKNLLDRELIRCLGRKDDIGRPMLFGTTDEFLRVYQLSSLKELLPLESFQPSSETIKKAMDRISSEAKVDIPGIIKQEKDSLLDNT